MSCDAGDDPGFFVTVVACPDLPHQRSLNRYQLSFLRLLIVRLVVQGDVVPEHHVSPCVSSGLETGSADLVLIPDVCG